MIGLRAGSATDTGLVRQNNEDNLLVGDTVFAVADGMGGHAAGEVAAEVAVEALRASLEEGHDRAPDSARDGDALVQAVRWANRAVWNRSQEDPDLAGMGTTLTAMALVEDIGPDGEAEEQLSVAHVGDSRAYLLRDGELEALTQDHTWVEELVRSGQLSARQARGHPKRSTLTRALGISPDVDVDVEAVVPYVGDRFVLCSDGLWDEVPDDELAELLRRRHDPDEAARDLVGRAKDHGGHDNITVVVVDVVDDDARAAKASAALADDPVTTGAVGSRTEAADGLGPDPDDTTSTVATAVATQERSLDRDPRARFEATPATAKAHGGRRLTARVLLFALAVVLVLGAAVGAVWFYASRAYYVGFDSADNETVAIYRGRPGGLLWVQPTLVERSDLKRAATPPASKPAIDNGKVFASLGAARTYVSRLRQEALDEGRTTIPGSPPTTQATTTVAPPTTPPTSAVGG